MHEGTIVYRPVPAEFINEGVYKLGGEEIFDSSDEIWEFAPTTTVRVKEKLLNGENMLVAISHHPD